MEEQVQIQNFISSLQHELSENKEKYKGIKFVSETYFYSSKKVKIIDGTLVKNNEIIAVFEFTPKSRPLSVENAWKYFSESKLIFRYIVVTNGEEFVILDNYTGEIRETTDLKELLNILLTIPTENEISELKKSISKIIEDNANKFFSDREDIIKHLSIKNVEKHLIFNENGHYFHLSKDIRNLSNFENKLFGYFLEDVNTGEEIHRYTSLETVFATINHKSIRLNGLVGMNDISEVGYVENYLDDANYLPYWDDRTSPQTISAINRRFILCSSSLEDDLNQWRLYGDDSTGAGLTFKVKRTSRIPGIQLKKVSYGKKRNNKNYHHELEFLKNVINDVKDKAQQSLKFRTLNIWKHFFKSFEYEPEKEVRLLIIVSRTNNIKGEQQHTLAPHSLKTEWNLTHSHKIINPFITIDLDDNDLPIKLTKIWLGPKSPEKYINKKQFEELLRKSRINYSGHHSVDVVLSNIKNYR